MLALLPAAPLPASAQSARPAALDPVIVTASRIAEPLSSVLADVSVIDRSAIERSGVQAVADLLARLPGIEFTRNGGPGSATGVFVRGGESRHTAVYIDGARVDSQTTGGAVWEQIPIEMIDRIEVLRGPAAAVYGSDAVSGVVRLFTRRGSGAAQPTASASYGTYDTLQAQAGVSGSADAFDYSLSAAYGRSDGFNARTVPGANPDDDGWRRSSGQARVGWRITPQHQLDASLLASNLESGYDGFSPGADEQNDHTLRSGTLGWEARWSDVSVTRLQFAETRSNYESQPDFYRTETTLRNYTLLHEQRLGAHLLTATLERRDDELVNPATLFAPALEAERHQNGVALGWRGDFGAHAVQAHVRRDDDSEFGGRNTGSLAWGWRFLPQWRLTASAATSFRAPTLYQRFSEYGNPSLGPEAGTNYELGLRWGSDASEVSLFGWRNTVEDLINFGAPGPCASVFGCFENIGRARLTGVTLAAKTQLAGVNLRGSLDWHDPRNLDTDQVLARRARQLATFGADTTWAGWNFGIEVQAAGERFEYDFSGNAVRMGGYGLLNLIVGRTLMPGLVVEGRIDNAGDKDYELASGYATAGRTVQVSMRWAMQ
jgi:vitamin B12 transporter